MSVGVAALDDQYKDLIRIIQGLHFTKESGGALGAAIVDLDRYVHEHFALEELMIREAAFEGFAAHSAKPRDFEARLQNVEEIRRHSAFASFPVAEMVIEFLQQWLVNHIVKADQEFVPALGRHLQSEDTSYQSQTREQTNDR